MPESSERWAIGSLTDSDGITFVSYRQHIPSTLRRELTEQFIIQWRFAHPRPNGLPQRTEDQEAREHELVLKPILEAGNVSILAFIATGNGYREFYFYCRDPRELQDRFNHAIAGAELPVALRAGHDPRWRAFDTFVGPLLRSRLGTAVTDP